MTHHVNNDGNVGVCSSPPPDGRCPFANNPHAKTKKEALAMAEKFNEKNARTKTVTITKEDLSNSTRIYDAPSISEFVKNQSLKEMDSAQLTQAILMEGVSSGMNPKKLSDAISLASILHYPQRRKDRRHNPADIDNPYIEHPLRNSLRLIRWGCNDEDTVVASLLHDNLEDGSLYFAEKFLGKKVPEITERAARIGLGQFISDSFGKDVLKTVEAVTNELDERPFSGTLQQKHQRYLQHVADSVKNNPQALLVKAADLKDNAGSLNYSDRPGNEKFVKKLAMKYQPTLQMILSQLDEQHPDFVDVEAVKNGLNDALERVEIILEKYKGLELK